MDWIIAKMDWIMKIKFFAHPQFNFSDHPLLPYAHLRV